MLQFQSFSGHLGPEIQTVHGISQGQRTPGCSEGPEGFGGPRGCWIPRTRSHFSAMPKFGRASNIFPFFVGSLVYDHPIIFLKSWYPVATRCWNLKYCSYVMTFTFCFEHSIWIGGVGGRKSSFFRLLWIKSATPRSLKLLLHRILCHIRVKNWAPMQMLFQPRPFSVAQL